jgi:hypothetical protein
VDHRRHYSEAFTVAPGLCFRMVQGKAGRKVYRSTNGLTRKVLREFGL